MQLQPTRCLVCTTAGLFPLPKRGQRGFRRCPRVGSQAFSAAHAWAVGLSLQATRLQCAWGRPLVSSVCARLHDMCSARGLNFAQPETITAMHAKMHQMVAHYPRPAV